MFLSVLAYSSTILFAGDTSMNKPPLRYWMRYPVGPLDTLKSDRVDVMPVAKNIYATLASVFMDGEPQPMIAEKWSMDDSGKIWRFYIRKGLIFDDGTPITPEVVLENFKRILWPTRNDGLALNALLPELKSWKEKKDALKSLYIDGDALVFHFARRPVNLFEEISMPIYGIANPKCFDEGGAWTGGVCPSASGQYKITDRTATKIVLKSRHIFAEAAAAPDIVEIYSPDATVKSTVQALLDGKGEMTTHSSLDLGTESIGELTRAGFMMVNEPAVRMHFVQLNHKSGVFADKLLRQSVRDVFLTALGSDKAFTSEIELNPSFIPKGGMGYLEFKLPKNGLVKKMNGQEVKILLTPMPGDVKSRAYQMRKEIEDVLLKALQGVGLRAKIVRCSGGELIENRQKGEFDVVLLSSGLSIYDPFCALRMMFMSKVGAEIPDPSGKIPGLIETAEASGDPVARKEIAEKINSSLFNEAAVINYASSGYVFIHSKKVDLSRMNIFSDPIEFRAVGWRP